MAEYIVKRYITHLGLTNDANDIDSKMQQNMNELAGQGWTVESVVATNDVGESRTIVVTYKRES